MTRRVRLLTFDRLPFTTHGVGMPETFQAGFGRLSATSVYFESHYDQSPESTDAQALGVGPGWDVLRQVIHDGNLNACAGFFGDGQHNSRTLPFPAWMNDAVQASTVDELVSGHVISGSSGSDLSGSDFVWLHVSLNDPAGDSCAFEQVLNAACKLCDLQRSDVLLVTAMNGLMSSRSDRFVSLVCEDSIRIPLWIHTPGMHGSRVHAVTGSRDILPTIIDCLADSGTIPNTDSGQTDAVSLLPALDDCAIRFVRDLRIESDGLRAVRSDNFLFVHRADPRVPEGTAFALYTKPDDVWNVHDVATEYTEVVNRLMQLSPE